MSSKENPFKIGDYLECIDEGSNYNIRNKQLYYVIATRDDYIAVSSTKGGPTVGSEYYPWRFRLVASAMSTNKKLLLCTK